MKKLHSSKRPIRSQATERFQSGRYREVIDLRVCDVCVIEWPSSSSPFPSNDPSIHPSIPPSDTLFLLSHHFMTPLFLVLRWSQVLLVACDDAVHFRVLLPRERFVPHLQRPSAFRQLSFLYRENYFQRWSRNRFLHPTKRVFSCP